MLKNGDRAPEFVLKNEQDRDVSLTDLLADGPLILYFYPADFTPGCTRESCTFRDLHDDLLSVGLSVAGISPQDSASHARFKARHALPFTLLADTDKTVAAMYGVNGPFGFGVRRASYLIDQGRRIVDAVRADFRISKHEQFIRTAIACRQTAGMTLKPID